MSRKKRSSVDRFFSDVAIVTRMAIADFLDDGFQSFYVTVAIAGVIAPILVLFGLREGVVQSLRSTMVEDPVFREVIPAKTMQYEDEFFDALKQREDVAFVLPSILAGASIITIQNAESGEAARPNLIPTAPDDPLLITHGVEAYDEAGVVLSAPLARKLDVEVDAPIEVIARRSVSGKSESVSETFTVIGILPVQAEGRDVVFAPSGYVQDVEIFREGLKVPGRNWPGEIARPAPRYDGVLVLTERPIPEDALALASSYTGLSGRRPLNAGRFQTLTGLAPFYLPEEGQSLDLFAEGSTVGSDSVDRLREEFRRFGISLFPYAEGNVVTLTLPDGSKRELRVAGAPEDKLTYESFGAPSPWPSVDTSETTASAGRKLILPASEHGSQWDKPFTVELEISSNGMPLIVPFAAQTSSEITSALVTTSEWVGILNTVRERNSEYDSELDTVVLSPSGYRGFRLYARSIDEVADLVAWLEDLNIPVRSRESAIARVQSIDAALMALLMVIVVLGFVSAVTIVAANVFALVRRRTPDLGMMRLLGFSKGVLYFYPQVQVFLAAFSAYALATGTYYVVSIIINSGLRESLGFEDSLAVLNLPQFGIVLLLNSIITLVSGFVGGRRVLAIEPREALRDE